MRRSQQRTQRASAPRPNRSMHFGVGGAELASVPGLLDALVQLTRRAMRDSGREVDESEKRETFERCDTNVLALFEGDEVSAESLVGLAAYVLDWTPEEVDGEFAVLYIYEIHVARTWRRQGLGSILLQEALSATRTAGISTVLLTQWTARGSTLNVSPTNKDFYRANKFSPTNLAERRAEYQIWRRDL